MRGRGEDALTTDDGVIKTFPSDRADQETGRSRMPMARMRRMKAARYAPSRSRDQVAWRLVPAAGLGQLTGQAIPHGNGLSHPATEATSTDFQPGYRRPNLFPK